MAMVTGVVGGPGGDLLSHVLRRSTMGASGFHGRVRNGVGWGTRAIGHQVDQPPQPHPTRSATWRGPRPPRHGRGEERAPWRGAGEAGVRQVRHGNGSLRLSLLAGEVCRAIRTGQLHASPRFHIRPIDVVVCHGSRARPGLAVGFPLRCVQRLSRPDLATRLRGWRHDRSTRGSSTPVLSY